MEGALTDNVVDRVDMLNGCRCLSLKRSAIIHSAAANVLEFLINLLCLSTGVGISKHKIEKYVRPLGDAAVKTRGRKKPDKQRSSKKTHPAGAGVT